MRFQFDLIPPCLSLLEKFQILPTQTNFPEEVISSSISLIKDALKNLQSQKGDLNHHKKNVIDALSILIVLPGHTLIIAHLFRPILIELVVRIASGRLISNIHNVLIATALSRLLPIAPHVLGFVLQYFRNAPSLFENFSSINLTTTDTDNDEIVATLRAALRFLVFSKFEFSRLWNWAPIYSQLHPRFSLRIRRLACECVSIMLGSSDNNRQQLRNAVLKGDQNNNNHQVEEDPEEFEVSSLINEESDLIEKVIAIANEHFEPIEDLSSSSSSSFSSSIKSEDLSTDLVDVCGILLSRQRSANDQSISTYTSNPNIHHTKLVETPTSLRNLHSLALALCQNNPILLEGVTGSGKTTLIDHLASITGNNDLIKVHLSDQADAKVLLGTYVCTDTPGEFRWQPGALVQAVSEGRWIVIEDIDLAPLDVISLLLPLLETRKLFVPSRGEELKAKHGFQIFGTQTLFGSGDSATSRNPNMSLMSGLWTKLFVEPLSSEELANVLTTSFPSLAGLIPNIIETYNTLTTGKSSSTSSSPSSSAVSMLPSGRSFSTRDLMKWCRRVSYLVPSSGIHQNGMASLQIREIVFQEAVDCFCGMIPKVETKGEAIRLLGSCWNISPDRIDYFISLHKPSIQLSSDSSAFSIGRVSLPISKKKSLLDKQRRNFAHTKQSLTTLEKISVCIHMSEPVLLIGETGTGKTSVVQYLADQLNQRLIVINLSQQTESADLLGGFKPVELGSLCLPLKNQFERLFAKTYSRKSNDGYLKQVQQSFGQKAWKRFLGLLRKAVAAVENKLRQLDQRREESTSTSTPNGGGMNPQLRLQWKDIGAKAARLEGQLEQLQKSFAFSFIEGSLVSAVRNGYWVLLDEINLAPTETLESLSGLLEGGSLCLTERGDVEPVPRHSNFRLFACMNPPTDVGKKYLPPGLRNRFTEFYVDETRTAEDLRIVVSSYINGVLPASAVPGSSLIDDVVDLYLAAIDNRTLLDGANQKPHYSLRTLCRTLEYAVAVTSVYGVQRAIYEGFCMSFLTQLNQTSHAAMLQLIQHHLVGKKGTSLSGLLRTPKCPGSEFVLFQHYWIETGDFPPIEPQDYIITDTIGRNLTNIARILLARKYPILLQGPTSSGKTSMVEYLAQRTGHKFVRINNHEHTDIQEYLGTYVSDEQGKLVFQEGILVEAVRKGYWVVLDELNLAPSEVLEALNRLLDDNRELLIPETQEVVKPHSHFMLFATQNPPGLYGGRKVLSRAFRNRFLELHVDDIPENELEIIIQKRCAIPPSHAKKLIAVMKDLQRQRMGTQVFAGKHGFITLRDLFRWANRKPPGERAYGYQELANEGYMLLAERLRRDDEKEVIRKTLEKHLNAKIDLSTLYQSDVPPELLVAGEFSNLVWTQSIRRIFKLVERCLTYKEPVLLVGETGCGKTTICQLHSFIRKQQLHILNCHQNTETADFLGGLRPVRGKQHIGTDLKNLIVKFGQVVGQDSLGSEVATSSVGEAFACFQSYWRENSQTFMDNEELKSLVESIQTTHSEFRSLFQWYDGPLVQAMKQGDAFLIDEISLAEDSVLERLNSVLEPNRLLVLAEKGGADIEEMRANERFRILATMNPGGDFGKKELSPAMRNRFTEIWVPPVSEPEDLVRIIEDSFSNPDLVKQGFSRWMLNFVDWINAFQKGSKTLVSLRDILSWVSFMNAASASIGNYESYLHGACLMLLDSFGMGVLAGVTEKSREDYRRLGFQVLIEKCPADQQKRLRTLLNSDQTDFTVSPSVLTPITGEEGQRFGMDPFYVRCGPKEIPKPAYSLSAPTTSQNAMRFVRGLQLRKPILLEGSPGVGKTSLVTAIAAVTGHRVVRINLSEQTDMMDLLGADLPVEGGSGGEFAWRDGVFLRALKAGDWVLLDELNLASQSVLEGLNSVLDHRAAMYIPELNREFICPDSFRVFACQNPTQQGGGRKGLPKSFLNRFTKVYINKLQSEDLLFIATAMFPEISVGTLRNMIRFNEELHHQTMVACKFGRKGSPWEFNLRDVFRWCDLMKASQNAESWNPGQYLDLVYLQRMRTVEDRIEVVRLFRKVFGPGSLPSHHPFFHISPSTLQIGQSWLPRNTGLLENVTTLQRSQLLPQALRPLEHIMKCVEMNWMTILIGAGGSGKTSLIRGLAHLTGNTLYEFAMNSSVDTTEILGGFEQVDLSRASETLASDISSILKQVTALALLHNESDDLLTRVQEIHTLWHTISWRNGLKKSSDTNNNQSGVDHDQHHLIEQLLTKTEQLCEDNRVLSQLPERTRIIKELKAELHRLHVIDGRAVTGCFEWIDGLLIKAMEKGDWVVIENANFCNPTVLDRLNPLVETNGELMVNERGVIDGEVKVIKPHKNFRLFLTMDPRNGEISRAMRNRGVEVFLVEPDLRSRDTTLMLNEIGIIGSSLPGAMIEFHSSLSALKLADRTITLRDLLHWASLTVTQLQRGIPLANALRMGMSQVYIRNSRTKRNQQQTHELYDSKFANWLKSHIDALSFLSPGLWPSLITTTKRYVLDSTRATIQRQSALYRSYLTQEQAASNIQTSAGTLTVSVGGVKPEAYSLSMLRASYGRSNTSLASPEDIIPLATRLDRYLRYAGEHFVATASLQDWIERVAWLHRQHSSFGAENINLKSSVASIASVLQQLFRHTVSKDIFELRDSILQQLGLDGTAFGAHQPIDPAQNDQLLAFIQSKVKASTEEVQGLWASYKVVAERIQLVIQLLYQRSKEEEQFENPSPNRTVIAVARDLFHKRATRDSFTTARFKEVLQHFYQLFQAIDEMMDGVCNLSCSQTTADDYLEQTEALRQLLPHRNALWETLNIESFDIEEFLINWRRFLKHLATLATESHETKGKVHRSHFLKTIIDRINEGLVFVGVLTSVEDLTTQKYLAWKFGGHINTFHHKELHDLFEELRDISTKADIVGDSKTSFDDHPFFYLDPKFKQTTLEAICTVFYLDSVDLTTALPLFQSLKNIVSSLQNQLQDAREKIKVPTEDEEVGAPIIEEKVALKKLFGHTVDALLPILDYSSVLAETSLLTTLQTVVSSQAIKEQKFLTGIEDLPNNLLESTRKFLNESLLSSSRSPIDCVPYQQLLWLSESSSHYKNQAITRLPDRSISLSALVQEMQLQWHSRLWTNVLSALFETDSSGHKSHETDVKGVMMGPSLLNYSLRSKLLFNLLTSWRSLPLGEFHSKQVQLSALREFLSNAEPSNVGVKSLDVKLLLDTFGFSVMCFATTFPTDVLLETSQLLQTLTNLMQSHTAINASAIEPVAFRLKELITHSTHKRFVELCVDFLHPFLEILSKEIGDASKTTSKTRGTLWVYLGAFRVNILLPPASCDPAAKYSAKLKTTTLAKIEVEQQREVLESEEEIFTGSRTNKTIRALKRKELELAESSHSLSKFIPLRPVPSQFVDLYKVMTSFIDSFTKKGKVTVMIERLRSSSPSVVSEEALWQDSTSHVLAQLERTFPQYRDVVHPFSLAVYQLKYGLRMLSASIIAESSLISQKSEKLITSLLQFPSLGSDTLLSPILNILDINMLTDVLSEIPAIYDRDNLRKSLLEAALLRCASHTYIVVHLREDALRILDQIFVSFMDMWKRGEAARKEKEVKDQELFKYKTKTLEGEQPEEADARMMKELFPDFSSEFDDIVDDDLTQEQKRDEALSNLENKKEESDTSVITSEGVIDISPELAQKIVHTYRQIFASQVESNENSPFDITTACYESYQAAGQIFDGCQLFLPQDLDDTLLPAHLIASKALSNQMNLISKKVDATEAKTPSGFNQSRYHDIYKDAYIAEASLALAPLRAIHSRLLELLEEWPDHPVLLQLDKIVDRIINFPVSSPLMRFLTGLELLLKKGEEWESYASSKVTLRVFLTPLSQLVARWRRLELTSWKETLQAKLQAFAGATTRWWFHLYELVSPSNIEEPVTYIDGLTLTLCELMQKSNFGEYSSRLELLRALSGQVRAELKSGFVRSGNVTSDIRRSILDLLDNILLLFTQYQPKINNLLQKQTVPIEKSLTEFVKLARWEDINYYGLKEISEKSHRKLAKLVRDLDVVLRKPVREHMDKIELEQLDDIGSTTPQKLTPYFSVALDSFVTKMETSASPASFLDRKAVSKKISDSFQLNNPKLKRNRLEMLVKKAIRITSEDILAKDLWKRFTSELTALEDLNTSIVVRTEELKAEKVPRTQKKLALTGLLQTLRSDVGLSYLVRDQRQELRMLPGILQLQPLPNIEILTSSSSSTANSVTEDTLKLFYQTSHNYFYRIIPRLSYLRGSLQTVTKDLNGREIRNSSGFVEHLFSAIVTQREKLSGFVLFFGRLQEIGDFTKKLSLDLEAQATQPDYEIFPHQQATRDRLSCLKSAFDRFVLSIAEVKMLLSATTADTLPTFAPVVAIETEAMLAKQQVDDHYALYCISRDERFATVTRIITGQVTAFVDKKADELSGLVDKIIHDVLPQLPISVPKTSVSNQLQQLVTQLNKDLVELKKQRNAAKLGEKIASSFGSQYEVVVTGLILSIQKIRTIVHGCWSSPNKNLTPESETEKEENKEEKSEEESEKEEDLEGKGNVVELQRFFERIIDVTSGLQDSFSELLSNVCEFSTKDTTVMPICAKLLHQLHPLLDQFLRLLQHFALDMVAFHKTSCKLEYILLALFSTLYTQGFCGSEEDGEAAEGQTEEGVEGTGMGEGKGDKDVSDDVTEDQIMSTQDKPKNEETQAEGEGVEMENDFDGDMHDMEKKEPEEGEEEEEDEEKKDIDKEMGELDPEKEEVLDEKLWNDEDEEEDEKKETGQDDESIEGNEKNNNDMAAAEGEEEEEEGKEPKPKGDQDNAEEETGDMPEEGEGDDEEEEGQREDPYQQDSNVDTKQEEEFDLPDNMELDDLGNDEEGGEGEDDGKESEDEDKEGEDEDKEEEEQNDQEDEGKEDGTIEEQMDLDQQENKEEDMEEEEKLLPQEPNTDKAAEEEAKEETLDTQQLPNQQPHKDLEQKAFGVQDKAAQPSDVQQSNEIQDGGDRDQESELKTQTEDEKSQWDHKQQQGEKAESKPPSARETANPYRNLGDATKEWKRRLDVVQDQQDKQGQQKEDEEKEKEKEEDPTYEFLNDEETEEDAQTMGAATENQARNNFSEAKEQEEEAGMEMDEEKEDDSIVKHQPKKEEEEAQQNLLPTGLKNAKKGSDMISEEKKEGEDEDKEEEEEEKGLNEDQKQNEAYSSTSSGSRMETGDEQKDKMQEEEEDPGEKSKRLREELDVFMADWSSQEGNLEKAQEVWKRFEALTSELSQELCEQLRLILEPTLATKLQGDYRTGKRINMKKVIPYIASQFKKDKIWLRRTKPNKRQYHVLVGIDDSMSMQENNVGQLACEALTLISNALARLEVGQLGILSFGEKVRALHTFDMPFGEQAGPQVITQFTFNSKGTNTAGFLRVATAMLEDARTSRSMTSAQEDQLQLVFILSDGRVLEKDVDRVKFALREMASKQIFVVFLIIDNPKKDSILDIKYYEKGQEGKFTLSPYIDKFPFPYYIILREINKLPEILADALRQWFEMIQRTN